MAAYLRILNLAKRGREELYTASCHLDFKVDLDKTVAAATGRHRVMTVKILASSMSVRTNRRLVVKALQKMLGLQIWIGTVFKVARQFHTSI